VPNRKGKRGILQRVEKGIFLSGSVSKKGSFRGEEQEEENKKRNDHCTGKMDL